MFHKEAGALKEFIFAASVWTVPVFLIAHRDIPSAQLMAPLHSNLVQYSPRQAEEGGVRYWFYFYKTFSRWSPRPRCFLLPQSLPGPGHQCVIAQTALTSHCHHSQPSVQCPVCQLQGGIIVWSVSGIQNIWHFSVTSWRIFTSKRFSQTLADCKLVKLTKLKFF